MSLVDHIKELLRVAPDRDDDTRSLIEEAKATVERTQRRRQELVTARGSALAPTWDEMFTREGDRE